MRLVAGALMSLLTAVAVAGPPAADAPLEQTDGPAAGQVESPEGRPESWCVAVWYPSSEHPGGAESVAANLDVIDIVHPFWYTPDASGAILDHSGSGAAGQVELWRAAGAIVMPSVFSGHAGYLTGEQRPAHVAAIVALVEANDYDGIDIDYEMFPLETREPFALFVEELADAMHANGRLLAVTVHAKTEDRPPFPSAAAQDWARLAAAADIFNLMTYDYTSRNEPPGPVADIGWVDDVVEYAATTTSGDKIRVGVPFYGYGWTRARPPARATTWEAAARLVEQFALEPTRDAASAELSLELDVTGLPRQVVYVSDAHTTAARLAALELHDTGGIAIWGMGGEDPGNWQVLREQRPADCALRTEGTTRGAAETARSLA